MLKSIAFYVNIIKKKRGKAMNFEELNKRLEKDLINVYKTILINGEWGKAFYYEKLETSTIDNMSKTISLVLKESAMKFNTKKEAEESLKEIIKETKKNPYLYDENNNFIYKFEIVQE